jgi:hypothetical protein
VRSRRGQVDVVWADGSLLRAWGTSSLWLSVLVWPSPDHVGRIRGLLGTFDGRPRNDLTTRGGRSLDVDHATARTESGFRLLYRVFGDGWRIRPKESLSTTHEDAQPRGTPSGRSRAGSSVSKI